jgi:hypothetical protein
MSICSRVFPVLSYTSFNVSGLILRSLIHFELIFVQGESHESSFPWLHADIQSSQKHVEEAVFSPLYVVGAFV